MHYSNKEFSKNGKNTIQAISDTSMPLGNVNSLSAVDVMQINLLYNCPEALRQGKYIGTHCVKSQSSVQCDFKTLIPFLVEQEQKY